MIKTLAATSIEEIHDAFVDAFSEYETKIEISITQLQEMLTIRSYHQNFSRGYYDGETLVGFVLIGYRDEDGIKKFYDIATGIRKKYQNKGISKLLLESIIEEMKIQSINKFILEVLEHNSIAQNLYKKYGFKITRKLCCFQYKINESDDENINIKFVINEEEYSNPEIDCGFSPSWQNSNASYRNSKQLYTKFDVYFINEIIGYLIINFDNGNILQLGIKENYRTPKILKNIMKTIKQQYKQGSIKYLNVELDSEIDLLLKKYGMDNFINQYEMEYNSK